MLNNCIKTLIGCAYAMVVLGSAYAVEPSPSPTPLPSLSIRLEAPKTPSNQKDFSITFVVLDTQNREPLTVQCFKKAPADSGFVAFGPTYTLSRGGNTGTCIVDSALVTSDSGSYDFYATATAGSDTVVSNTVTVTITVQGLNPPTNYSKNQLDSCRYEIKFRTSDDGKTVKVELYRSQNTSFSADSGSRVGVLSIGSNEDGVMTDNVSDCTKTYYHVIRAFDAYGNGSAVVGDAIANVTVTHVGGGTTTVGGGATTTENIGPAAERVEEGQSQVAEEQPQGETTEGETKGAEVVNLGDLKGVAENMTAAAKSLLNPPFLIGLAILVLVGYGYIKSQKGNTPPECTNDDTAKTRKKSVRTKQYRK